MLRHDDPGFVPSSHDGMSSTQRAIARKVTTRVTVTTAKVSVAAVRPPKPPKRSGGGALKPFELWSRVNGTMLFIRRYATLDGARAGMDRERTQYAEIRVDHRPVAWRGRLKSNRAA